MKETYPLSVNGYIKNNNIPCRVNDRRCIPEKSGTVMLTLFDYFENVRSLDEPELVSSIHGPIKRILFTIPNRIFREQNTVIGEKSAVLFQYLLKTLSVHAKILIIINESAQDNLNNWIEKFNINAKAILVADTMNLSIWSEDSYCICYDLHDAENYIVKPLPFPNVQQINIADTVVVEDSEFIRKEVDLYFEGGNMLIGDDFWLIGKDSINRSISEGCITNIKGDECKVEAAKRMYKLNLDNHRALHIIGSDLKVPLSEERDIQTMSLDNKDRTGWREILYKGNKDETEQPIFHLDMFISLAGRNPDGKYQVLVGSPKLAAELLDMELPEGNMQEIFDNIAYNLKKEGFEVIRNPMPLIYDDDDNAKIRQWYFASANNVLLQDQPEKTVWLPTYGHGTWQKLEVTDKENKAIWERLGYNVMMLPDCHILAARNGVVHCISKYLSRIDRYPIT